MMRNPASHSDLEAADTALGGLPPALRALLGASDGIEGASGVALYHASELEERQCAYEMRVYAPGQIAIGDDGGGRVVILDRASGKVSLIDAGAIGSDPGTHLTDDLRAWVNAGLPLPTSHAQEVPDEVDVYLERPPMNGNQGLVAIKVGLGLEFGIVRLKAMATNTPVRILRCVPYGKYAVLSRRLNKTCSCLGFRVVDHPSIVVPISQEPATEP